MNNKEAKFSDLTGKTLTEIVRVNDDELIFHCNDGTSYSMYHDQGCCESVTIDDIVGELSDLLETPVLIASEETNSNHPVQDDSDESFTWTFFKISTIKGHVTIKWYGQSNGYYSESVDFKML